MTNNIDVITIDGPSGSGKGTIGMKLAETLGWHFLDSGALYRVLVFYAFQNRVTLENVQGLVDLALRLPVSFSTDNGLKILLNNEDVTRDIRTEACGNLASRIAVLPEVRQALLQRQRDFLQSPGLVADGRDMGTIVFPNAKLKFFLDASAEERAKRRYLQLKNQGLNIKLDNIINEIKERDARDKERVIAPLVPAEDAITIDTTGMDIKEVLTKVSAFAQKT